MKQCIKCGIEKPEEAFRLYKNKYRSNECRECKYKSNKAWNAKRKLNPPQQKPETKRCNTCHEVKPISEFSPRDTGYFHGRCKACEVAAHREKRREQYRNDPTGRFYWPFENEAGVIVKRCTSCHAEKPLSEFYTNSKTRQTRHGKCKECDKTLKKLIYDNNPEKYRAISREWAQAHPDEKRARLQRWRSANQEHLLHRYRTYNETHREERRAYNRSPQHRVLANIWDKAHPEIAVDKQHRRRARKRNAPRIERINRKVILERDKWTCYLCGLICTPQNVTLDHVIPLFHNGSHTADNLRVACRSCNCRKGHKLREFLA